VQFRGLQHLAGTVRAGHIDDEDPLAHGWARTLTRAGNPQRDSLVRSDAIRRFDRGEIEVSHGFGRNMWEER
jgi:hypothetical protein